MADNEAAFRVLLRIQTHPGVGADFERVWLEVGNSVTEHPANQGQWLLRGTDEDDVYYIISDWVDEPGFREFEKSDRHIEHRQKLHPFRIGGTMATMNVVYHLQHGTPAVVS